MSLTRMSPTAPLRNKYVARIEPAKPPPIMATSKGDELFGMGSAFETSTLSIASPFGSSLLSYNS
jgi:hypothetical protein